MFKKIILLLLISCIAVAGFAQKSKRKSLQKAPKSSYFTMMVNEKEAGEEAGTFCPDEPIDFHFTVNPDNPEIEIINRCWWNNFDYTENCSADTITLSFPNTLPTYRVSLTIIYEIPTDTVPFIDTVILSTLINIDFFPMIDTLWVCQGRNITVGDTTLIDVQDPISILDTLYSTVTGECDTLVGWQILVYPYIDEEYSVSSCDSVVWGDGTDLRSKPPQIIIHRPPNHVEDWDTTVVRIFLADDSLSSCDTRVFLHVTIIGAGKLVLSFSQEDFCAGEDMGGDIKLETNFTAFDWRYVDKDSTWTVFEPDITTLHETSIFIEDPGEYEVLAYMDTSLYETLDYLRIVATTCAKRAKLLVEDCPLVIPNVITPGNDGINDILGIKKLNPIRENELTIYDRWGKKVYNQKNYQCVFKKGSYHNIDDAFAGISQGGRKLPDGTYYYAFKYASIPKSKTYTGIITILNE